MDENKYKYSHAYLGTFNPRNFLQDFYSSLQGSESYGEMFAFNLQSNIALSNILPKKLGKALDFGCGPVVVGLMPVVEKVESILYADYVEANLKEIDLWMSDSDKRFDQSHFSSEVSKSIGISSNEIENQLRSKFKGTVKCDALADNVLSSSDEKEFGYIYTSLCLEGCCSSKQDYDQGIAKLGKLLSNDGFALQICILNQHEYECNGVTMPNLSVSYEEAKAAWVSAGCQVVESRHLPNIAEGSQAGLCAILVQKKSK